jgi:hypothetical protein
MKPAINPKMIHAMIDMMTSGFDRNVCCLASVPELAPSFEISTAIQAGTTRPAPRDGENF